MGTAPLITTLVAALCLAFVFGAVAHKFRLPPLVGYLLAGVLVGPHTPGFVADQALGAELADIGVVLLMFGIGLQFSPRDLLAVRALALPGTPLQILFAAPLGVALGRVLGWSWPAACLFGFSLTIASTVVLLKALADRRLVETERGRLTIGWAVAEDLTTVLALVLIPSLAAVGGVAAPHASGSLLTQLFGEKLGLAGALALTLGQAALFVVVMLVVGRRAVPALLHWTAHEGSRELFRLALLAVALGTAFASARFFGVSLAIGAFFAGMILAESELSQRAAQETLPLRDAFAVLFFVSVGMLFNPQVLTERPLAVAATVAIVVAARFAIVAAIARAFRYDTETALTLAAARAQIGEFSFILASMGLSLSILPQAAHDLIVAGALLSIILNPAVFWAVERRARPASEKPNAPARPQSHAIVVGYGRVGKTIALRLQAKARTVVVVDEADNRTASAAAEGLESITGNAAQPEILALARIAEADTLYVAVPDAYEAGAIVETARTLNPAISVVVRARSDAEAAHFRALGAGGVVLDGEEIAAGMLSRAG